MGLADRVERDFKQDELRRRESARRATEAAEAEALQRRDQPELVFKRHEQEREPPRPEPSSAQDWQRWTLAEIEYAVDTLRDATGMVLGQKSREVRDALGAEVDLLRRQLAQLRAEFDADRGIKHLHEEIAAARADVPQIPAIEERVAAEQAGMKKEIARLRSELKSTRDKVADLRVENSQVNHALSLLEKKQLPKPSIQVSLSTPDSSFILRDEDRGALSAWQRFLDCALTSNSDAEASVKGRTNGAA